MTDQPIILKCADIVVRAFMAAMFNSKYDGVGGKENWGLVYTEYIDLSGIGETQEFNLLCNIHNVQQRLTQVQGYVDMLKKFFETFKQPFEPAINDLRKFGHRITWDAENPKQFTEQLDRVEIKEKKYLAELDSYINELESLKKNGVKVDGNSRANFVKLINRLGKEGYKIDKDKTDMEELSLMIREYNDEMQQRVIDAQNKE